MIKTAEKFLYFMVFVLVALIVAGFILKFMTDKGILPSVVSKIGALTNIQAQAGG